MDAPKNLLKRALAERQPQIGLWLSMANAYCAEMAAGAGFDWLLIDGEHAPNDIRSVLAQLQALAAYPLAPVARVPVGETWMIKQYLDVGVQNLLVPMVETAEQARAIVAATRYPPKGVRGVGSALARASGFNRLGRYVHSADDEICLLVQVESIEGVAHLDEIAATEGVDGVFIGPADLSATMGHRGNPQHEEVQGVIDDAIARILAAGKAPGILIGSEELSRRYLDMGALFVAVGTDVGLFTGAARALASRFGRGPKS